MDRETERWKYIKVAIDLIDNAELNANKMSDKDFEKLCRNIGSSGLSSVPACYKKANGRYVMISGHHRLLACKKLGWKEIGILYADESDLTQDEIIAIQLSHNSLHGSDDKGILKMLFSQIQSVDFKDFANIEIDEIGSAPTEKISMAPLMECYTISVVLYPTETECFNELVEEVDEIANKSDIVILSPDELSEEKYLALTALLRKKYDIRSPKIAFSKILEIAYEKLHEEHN